MSRLHGALIALAVALAAAGTAYAMGVPKLNGSVGPSFTIGLKQGGKTVKTLKAGKYAFVVKDRATIHDFHLVGPGVNKKTSVDKTQTATWTLRLKKGSYKFYCDVHPSLNGHFKVT